MKVVCPSCGTRYQVDDDRVAGRNLKLRCRKCGVAIMIRGAKASAPRPSNVAPVSTAPTSMELSPASVKPPPAPSPSPPVEPLPSLEASPTSVELSPAPVSSPPADPPSASVPSPLVKPPPASPPVTAASSAASPATAPEPTPPTLSAAASYDASVDVPEPVPEPVRLPGPESARDGSPLTSLPAGDATARATDDDPSFDVQAVLGRGPSLFSPAVLFALVAALGLGVTLGYVLFGGEKVKIVREIVEVPAPVAEAVPDARSAEGEPAPDGVPPEANAPEAPRVSAGAVKLAAAAADSSTSEGLPGLSGLKGLGTGPQTGPSGSSPSSAAQALDSGQIQGVIHRYTPAVRRSCWQPALDARDPSAPASARVTVSLTVGANGVVQSATGGADPKGYPGLSRCVAERARTWTFPPSGGTTTVEVPFVFAVQ